MPDEAGVEAAGFVDVFGAFDNGAGVGEKGDFQIVFLEPQEKFIAEHFAGGLEFFGHRRQVENGFSPGSNLHGVSAAEGDGAELSFAGKKFKLMLCTAGTAGFEIFQFAGSVLIGPEGKTDETAIDACEIAGEDFQGLGGFEGGGGHHRRCDDACGVAGIDLSGLGRLIENAAETGFAAGEDGHAHDLIGQAGAIDPGDGVLDGNIINKEAREEIVGAVEEEVRFGVEKVFDAFMIDVGDVGRDNGAGVDGAKTAGGGGGFGHSLGDIPLIEERLSGQIGKFNKVAVDEGQGTDACADEGFGDVTAQRAAAYKEDSGGGEFLLALRTDGGKKALTGVAGL